MHRLLAPRLIRRNTHISSPRDRISLPSGTSFGIPTRLQEFVPDMVCPEVTVFYPEELISEQPVQPKEKKPRTRSGL